MPAAVATFADSQLFANGWVHYGATISGIITFTIISLQFVLAARIPWIVKTFSFKAVFRLHKSMAVVAMLLAVVHVGLLVWSRGNWNLLLIPLVSWPIQLGRITFVLLISLIVFSFGRKWIPINNADWRWFHNALAWSILIMGFVHSITMGSSFEGLLYALIWTGYFVIAISAWVSRKYFLSHN